MGVMKMKKATKRIAAALMATTLCVGMLAGCGAKKPAAGGDGKKEGAPKVALIMQGPISDMAWNATAYKGLTEIEKLGAEVSYQENVAVTSLADSMRTYATEGYDLIFLSTNSYADIAKTTAPEFPNSQFILINGNETVGNLCSLQIADEEQGFMMGAIAAIAAKGDAVGFVGGEEITPIINGQKGFEQGAKYIDENVKINATLTGSMSDVNRAKETAKAMLETGVAVIAPMCDQSAIGVLEAAEEGSAKSVCSGPEQAESAPKGGLMAVVKDTSVAYVAAYKKYVNNELGSDVVKMGAKDGVIFLTDFFSGAGDLTADQKTKVQETYDALSNGTIKINLD
jgi:basic membrane protein A